MLVNKSKAGILELELVGPYVFVSYKDYDQHACILRDKNGKEFDCSMVGIVLVKYSQRKLSKINK